MRLIRMSTYIMLVTSILWATLDLAVTQLMGVRGFSTWFQSDEVAGRINKPSLKGFWGGPLDDFYVEISINEYGLRSSLDPKCEKIKKQILFVGDSTTAAYEVEDKETFISNINSTCDSHQTIGTNLGVRGNDTHSAIGIYDKFSKIIDHDTVFYLITSNDFWENNDRDEYFNITRHFGRRFEDKIIKKESDWITSNYLNFRIFVSDNFYFTTKLISAINYSRSSKKNYYISLNRMTQEVRSTMPLMVDLLNDFQRRVENRNAEFIVTMYPCMTPKTADNWTDTACSESEKTESELYKKINARNDKIQHLEMNKTINRYITRGCFSRDSLTFNRDRHLSRFGHYVFSQILRKYLLKDVSYDRSVLCDSSPVFKQDEDLLVLKLANQTD